MRRPTLDDVAERPGVIDRLGGAMLETGFHVLPATALIGQRSNRAIDTRSARGTAGAGRR